MRFGQPTVSFGESLVDRRYISRGFLTVCLLAGAVAVAAVLLAALSACTRGTPRADTGGSSDPGSGGSSAAGSSGFVLAFAGDVLPHLTVVGSTADPVDGGYDFAPTFAPVAPYLAEADLAVANLETRFAGAARGYQGYPRFNSPDELALGLADSGLDAVATANNHALDMGFEGVARTLDVLDAAGLYHAGTARSAVERDSPCMVDVRGDGATEARVALLNYTEHTNGLPPPQGRAWAIALLSEEAVGFDVARARSAGADLVVAFVHWGDEYTRYPAPRQRDLAVRMLDAGVDVIVGSGPHMVQPVTVVRTLSGREGFVAWSLGNFVADQPLRYRDAGVVLYLDAVEDDDRLRVAGVRYLPVFVQSARSEEGIRFRVVPVHPDIALGGGLGLSPEDRRRIEQVWSETTSHLAGEAGVTPYRPEGSEEPDVSETQQ